MDAQKGEDEFLSLVRPTRLALEAFGCWPSSGGEPRPWLHALLAGLAVATLAVGDSVEAFTFWGDDMNETIECTLVTSVMTMALLRVIVLSCNRKPMLYLIDTMKRDWNDSSPEERALLRKECAQAFRLSRLFIASILLNCLVFAVTPYFEYSLSSGDVKRRLPFRGYYFFDLSAASAVVYNGVYAFNVVLGAIGCCTVAGATSFSFVATIHGAAKFAVAKKKFEALTWSSAGSVGRCVQEHQQSLKFAQKLEEVINLLALGQFVISSGLLCFAGFQLITLLQDRGRFMKYSMFLTAAIMELFIFSFGGQTLQSESLGVAESCLKCDWLGGSRASDMIMILLRARKACTITAGKFYDMSFESFLKVLSSSFSYFTVLIAIREE